MLIIIQIIQFLGQLCAYLLYVITVTACYDYTDSKYSSPKTNKQTSYVHRETMDRPMHYQNIQYSLIYPDLTSMLSNDLTV